MPKSECVRRGGMTTRARASAGNGRGRLAAGRGRKASDHLGSNLGCLHTSSLGDIDAARELVETAGPELAELFIYPGDRHLFTDSSLSSYDADALVMQRSRAFLHQVG